jgi:hypothetical protein
MQLEKNDCVYLLFPIWQSVMEGVSQVHVRRPHQRFILIYQNHFLTIAVCGCFKFVVIHAGHTEF